MSRRHLAALALLLAVAPAARASDPVGIYAVVDRVVLEPSSGPPERVQVWGAFALAEGSGDRYAPPVRGYMYFSLARGKEDVCRREWADLKKVAGTRQCVALGARYEPRGTVRRGGDPTKSPDVYPLGVGVTKVPARNHQARRLLALAAPPREGEDRARP